METFIIVGVLVGLVGLIWWVNRKEETCTIVDPDTNKVVDDAVVEDVKEILENQPAPVVMEMPPVVVGSGVAEMPPKARKLPKKPTAKKPRKNKAK